MSKLIFITVVLAVLVVSESEGRRGGGNRRGNRGGGRVRGLPEESQDVSMWNRTLTLDNPESAVKEAAYSIASNDDQIYVVSGDKRKLKSEGYKKSMTIYDFTGGSSVVVLKVKKSCFLLDRPADLTRSGVLQQTSEYNGQTRDATTPVDVYVIELEQAQTDDLDTRDVLKALCNRKPIRALSTTAPADPADDPKVVKVTTLDEQLSITLPARAGGRRGGGGRRGARGGRGGGRRGNRGQGGSGQ